MLRAVCRETGDDTLVWMYNRLKHVDRRRFWTLQTPGERLLFLVDGGSCHRRSQTRGHRRRQEHQRSSAARCASRLGRPVPQGVSLAKGNFTALPAVPEELHRIFRQGETGDAPISGRVQLDLDFTRASFEAAMRQPDKSVVHIATHFDSQPGVAANSHLLLGDGSEMSLAEIEATPRLFSGVDLLTLSACSTAITNGAEDGREVDSFGTIAQRLGARGVIASLWSVSDEATARLMETMYRIRQDKPELGKSEALRHAQQQMADGILKPDATSAADRGVRVTAGNGAATAWTHPYYWAPFILIGNWK